MHSLVVVDGTCYQWTFIQRTAILKHTNLHCSLHLWEIVPILDVMLDDLFWEASLISSCYTFHHNLLVMLEGIKAELGQHVQVVEPDLVILVHQTIKESHAASMQWREPCINVVFWCRLIPKVERERVPIVSQAVTLKPITFLLESDTKFVLVLTLESHSLFITRQIPSRHPCIAEDKLQVAQELVNFEVRVCLS